MNDFRAAENPNLPGKPKAYLNWILLDEQFIFTEASSGALEVGNPDEIVSLSELGIEMTKSGYLYTYVSNETQNWDSLSRTEGRDVL